MSVILYEDEKFYRVYKSLWRHYCQEMAHIWGYPDNWRTDGMIPHFQDFVQKLRSANIEAYQNRYAHNQDALKETEMVSKELEFNHGNPYLNTMPYNWDCELIKSLRGISYNIVESENFEETKQKLFKVIYFLMSREIERLPEYKKAQTW
jgi:hypothetical protein